MTPSYKRKEEIAKYIKIECKENGRRYLCLDVSADKEMEGQSNA